MKWPVPMDIQGYGQGYEAQMREASYVAGAPLMATTPQPGLLRADLAANSNGRDASSVIEELGAVVAEPR